MSVCGWDRGMRGQPQPLQTDRGPSLTSEPPHCPPPPLPSPVQPPLSLWPHKGRDFHLCGSQLCPRHLGECPTLGQPWPTLRSQRICPPSWTEHPASSLPAEWPASEELRMERQVRGCRGSGSERPGHTAAAVPTRAASAMPQRSPQTRETPDHTCGSTGPASFQNARVRQENGSGKASRQHKNLLRPREGPLLKATGQAL